MSATAGDLRDEEDEEDVCRICRMAGEPENPLFFPCKCSGSIRYVHEQCLTEWLNHSGNTHCEVCKFKFRFTPVYAENAPSTLPFHELLVGMLKRALRGLKTAYRIWLVAFVWLVCIPLYTSWAWRTAFSPSFSEVPELIRSRLLPIPLLLDCCQGLVLALLMLVVNTLLASLRDTLRYAITHLEHHIAHLLTHLYTQQRSRVAPHAAPNGPPAAPDHPPLDDPTLHHPAVPPAPGPAGPNQPLAANAAAANADAFANPLPPVAPLEPPPMFEEDVDFEDIPFEELIGLDGPWVCLLESILLVLIINSLFVGLAVATPLHLGRHLVPHWDAYRASLLSSINPSPFPTAATLITSAASPFVSPGHSISNPTPKHPPTCPSFAPTFPPLPPTCHPLLAPSAATFPSCPVPHLTLLPPSTCPAAPLSGFPPPIPASHNPPTALPLEPILQVKSLMDELVHSLQPPSPADIQALLLGQAVLSSLLLLLTAAYVSARLLVAATRHLRALHPAAAADLRMLLLVTRAVLASATRAAAALAAHLKLALLIAVELGAFPAFMGYCVDLCLLPLTAATPAARLAALVAAPLTALLLHWALGIAFMLALLCLLCTARDVLRPGALPFLKDPTAHGPNPLQELAAPSLAAHAVRIAWVWASHAALAAVLLHAPALLARTLAPGMWPLQVRFEEPLHLHMPADMLLLNIAVSFASSHLRAWNLCTAAMRAWLAFAGHLTGLRHYLLPPPPAPRPALAPAPAPGPLPASPDSPPPSHDHPHPAPGPPRPVADYQAAPHYPYQVAALTLLFAASSIALSTAALLLPVHTGRFLLTRARLFASNDLFAAVVGLYAIWALTAAARTATAAAAAAGGSIVAAAAAVGRCAATVLKCCVVLGLWAGVGGLLTGMLVDLVLLPLKVALRGDLLPVAAQSAAAAAPQLPPPQRSLWLLLYHDWLVGVVTLKLWHLILLLPLRRAGGAAAGAAAAAAAADADGGRARLPAAAAAAPPALGLAAEWRQQLEAVYREGVWRMGFRPTLTQLVGPLLAVLGGALVGPYVVAWHALPALGLPPRAVRVVQINIYAWGAAAVVGWWVVQVVVEGLRQMHDVIRDDRYLVGLELVNVDRVEGALAAEEQAGLVAPAGGGSAAPAEA